MIEWIEVDWLEWMEWKWRIDWLKIEKQKHWMKITRVSLKNNEFKQGHCNSTTGLGNLTKTVIQIRVAVYFCYFWGIVALGDLIWYLSRPSLYGTMKSGG